MRNLCLFLSLWALNVSAVTLDVPKLPAPAYADGERSCDVALPANRTENLRLFRLEVTFNLTPSNNVQVAFGRDNLPADGYLAAEETDLIIGWDCEEWFLRPQGLRERHVFNPANLQAGRRTLTLEIAVDAQGLPKSAVFKDGADAFAFPELKLAPFPAWLKPDLWTHLRVTVRGKDNADEKVRVQFLQEGASGQAGK